MNDFFENKWEWLSGLWRKEDEEVDGREALGQEEREILKEQFEIRQAMYGLQKQRYDVEGGWRKVRPTIWYRRAFRISKYAAVILLGVGLAYWGMMSRTQEESLALTKDSITPGQSKAEFVLATGERIQVDIHQRIYASDVKGVVITNDTVSGRVQYQVAEGQSKDSLAFNTFIVPKGGEYSLELADGSVVWMNSESSLRFPEKFSSDKREVYLDGEAYFQVTKDSNRPFYVRTKNYDVRVLGTTFNVSAYRDDRVWHTTLVEGAVLVDRDGSEILLKPNEQYQMNVESGNGSVKEVVPELYTSWVDGKFYFKAYAFEELVGKLERWYDFKMIYVNPEIKQRRFSGVVNKHQPLQDMLKFLEMTSNVRFKVEGNVVTASLNLNKKD